MTAMTAAATTTGNTFESDGEPALAPTDAGFAATAVQHPLLVCGE